MKRKRTNRNFFNGGPRNLLIGVLIIFMLILGLSQLTNYARQVNQVSYSTFIEQVKNNNVKSVHVDDSDVYGIYSNGDKFETVIPNNPKNWDLLEKHKVDVVVASNAGKVNMWYFLPLLILLGGIFGFIWFFMRQARGSSGGGGGPNIFSMGKSRAKMFMPSTIKENFNSVAGAVGAKEELQDIVNFLKNPEKFKRLGAKMTRGILLVGDPGNGKTLLAKAVAGEANCPFFSISGSDFIEVFVGVGAARVRDLFAQARKHAPSIIFIDEIDAVGRHRGSGLGGGHDEREQTLNQLLTEMDGFQTKGGSVIVLAASNRPDVLDKALLRPGRFDRRVDVPYPDLESRKQILHLHSKGVSIDETVDLNKIARGTPGFSGADLANLINEAALIATNRDAKKVTVEDFEEARDKVTLGKESKTMILTDEERKVTAYHEAGHALIRLLLPDVSDPLHKVTIVPRGRALGVTHSLPEKDKYTDSKDRMIALVKSCLGGRAAEEIVFNTLETGAYSDFLKATDIVRRMVCLFGMSDDLGTVVYRQQQGDYEYSQKTAERIDAEVEHIMRDCYKGALELLRVHRDKLDTLAVTLLEKETLYAAQVYELLGIEPRVDHRFTVQN